MCGGVLQSLKNDKCGRRTYTFFGSCLQTFPSRDFIFRNALRLRGDRLACRAARTYAMNFLSARMHIYSLPESDEISRFLTSRPKMAGRLLDTSRSDDSETSEIIMSSISSIIISLSLSLFLSRVARARAHYDVIMRQRI